MPGMQLPKPLCFVPVMANQTAFVSLACSLRTCSSACQCMLLLTCTTSGQVGSPMGPPMPCVSALTALTWQPESGNRLWKISAASIDDMCSYQPWAAALGGSHDDR